jgi:hypothetical protein
MSPTLPLPCSYLSPHMFHAEGIADRTSRRSAFPLYPQSELAIHTDVSLISFLPAG